MTTVTRIETDVAVVGGGPAGLAAATAAAERDRRVVLLDAYARLGGQYHMQPLPGVESLQIEKQATAGRQAIDRAAAAGAMLRRGAEVFWAERRDGGFRLHAADEGGGLVVDARCVVVATGAMERALPFPGWTLPGVLGAGAAQRLIKTGGIAPGKRVVLAGTGPFLHAVAATFAKAGFPLAMILEAGRPGAAVLAALSRHPERWAEALGLLAATRSGGATRVEGWAVVEALGERQVEAVRIAPIGSDGRADMARSEVVDGVDALAVGYGFRPVVDITALLKAGHRYDEAAGGWASAADPVTGATEVDGLYACGETVGVGGAVPARLSGRLAGAAAAAVARGDKPAAEPSDARQLARARSFAAALARAYPFPEALAAQLAEGATICRCEDVDAAAIHAAIADGARTVAAVKMWTRAGMGPCQGRTCGPALAGLVARACGGTVAAAGFNAPHLPLRPVPIAVVEACLSVD